MGLFDNFIKQIDNELKAVENGALEERLTKFADAIDRTTKQAGGTVEKLSEKPGVLLKQAEEKKEALSHKAKLVKKQVGKNMDIIQKKG